MDHVLQIYKKSPSEVQSFEGLLINMKINYNITIQTTIHLRNAATPIEMQK